jgi:hypothetical protein
MMLGINCRKFQRKHLDFSTRATTAFPTITLQENAPDDRSNADMNNGNWRDV